MLNHGQEVVLKNTGWKQLDGKTMHINKKCFSGYSLIENEEIKRLVPEVSNYSTVVLPEECLTKAFSIAGLEWDNMINGLNGLTGVSNG